VSRTAVAFVALTASLSLAACGNSQSAAPSPTTATTTWVLHCKQGTAPADSGYCVRYPTAATCIRVMKTYIGELVGAYNYAYQPGISSQDGAKAMLDAGSEFNWQWKFPSNSNVGAAWTDVGHIFWDNFKAPGEGDYVSGLATPTAANDCTKYAGATGASILPQSLQYPSWPGR